MTPTPLVVWIEAPRDRAARAVAEVFVPRWVEGPHHRPNRIVNAVMFAVGDAVTDRDRKVDP